MHSFAGLPSLTTTERRRVTGELLDEARLLLEANTREGWWKGQRYVFTVPSASVYPFQ